MRRLDERGETLVEVIMALAILSLVLVSSYALATGTFRLGRGAGERTQAVNYLQEQAEALRSYRNTVEWERTFADTMNRYNTDPPFDAFCMKKEDNVAGVAQWVPVIANDNPACIIDGVTLTIRPAAVGSPPKQFDFKFEATWKTGSQDNNVTLTTKLTDQTP